MSSTIRQWFEKLRDAFSRECGCKPEAADGQQALAACSFGMPDAIFLDANMPVLDGFEFLKALRRMPGGDRPKVVYCTSEHDVSQIARAMHAGADDYIMKPFDREVMEMKFEGLALREARRGRPSALRDAPAYSETGVSSGAGGGGSDPPRCGLQRGSHTAIATAVAARAGSELLPGGSGRGAGASKSRPQPAQ